MLVRFDARLDFSSRVQCWSIRSFNRIRFSSNDLTLRYSRCSTLIIMVIIIIIIVAASVL